MSIKKAKKETVVLIIPTENLTPTIQAINNASSATDTALGALDKLDNKFPTLQAKQIAEQLVTAGAQWTANTIMQELSRIRALKKAGKWIEGMTSYQAREAHKELPRGTRAKSDKPESSQADNATVNATISSESAEKLTGKISRNAPDTIANALIEAIIQSGKDDLEEALKEARRLIVEVINAKKKASKK